MAGEIGGVGLKTGTIRGLKNTLFDVLEGEHTFLIAGAGKGDGPPFSDRELRQLIRELATNIFLYGKGPLFSLHFNQDGSMYPVIPPEYATTLVGRVMGMLDYMMKGYLNGGIFTGKFVDAWAAGASPTDTAHRDGLVDLRDYCRKHLGDDFEHHTLQSIMGVVGVPRPKDEEQRYRSSFRIIADNPIVQTGAMFKVGADFRVDYTIEAMPEFEGHLRRYRAGHGCDPDDYVRLNRAYTLMAEQIRQKMPRLPMCRKYFSMLGLIHFFSYCLGTLKDMHKVVALPPEPAASCTVFPRLLPALPMRMEKDETNRISWQRAVGRLSAEDRQQLVSVAKVVDAHPSEQMNTSSPAAEAAVDAGLARRLFSAVYAEAQGYLHAEPLLKNADVAPLVVCKNFVLECAASLAAHCASLRGSLSSMETTIREYEGQHHRCREEFTANLAAICQKNAAEAEKARCVFARSKRDAQCEGLANIEGQRTQAVSAQSGWFLGPSPQTLRFIDQAAFSARLDLTSDLARQELNFDASLRAAQRDVESRLREVDRKFLENNAPQRAALREATERLAHSRKVVEDPFVDADFLRDSHVNVNLRTTFLANTTPNQLRVEGSQRYRVVGGCGLSLPTTTAMPLPGSVQWRIETGVVQPCRWRGGEAAACHRWATAASMA